MNKLIVIGASAGGLEVLKRLAADLPADLDAAICIVWHISPDVRGLLPEILSKVSTLTATNAIDGELMKSGHMYIAPPDKHLIVVKNQIRTSSGPKENRFRPAIDPLFRSAAYAYGSRVIGIILSGALDDGAAGLWTIKSRGGMAIVQDPAEADVPSMPENALRAVDADFKVTMAEIGPLLVKLCKEPILDPHETSLKNEMENDKIQQEIRITLQEAKDDESVMELGELSPYSCPECHGVLTSIKEGNLLRFRCHTGHAFSAGTLLADITKQIEDSLWSAIRGVEEKILLLNHMGDHFAEENEPKEAAAYFKKATEAEKRIKTIRETVMPREQLSADYLMQHVKSTEQALL